MFYFYFDFLFKQANLKTKESIWCGLKAQLPEQPRCSPVFLRS